jgi:hypothetical protein
LIGDISESYQYSPDFHGENGILHTGSETSAESNSESASTTEAGPDDYAETRTEIDLGVVPEHSPKVDTFQLHTNAHAIELEIRSFPIQQHAKNDVSCMISYVGFAQVYEKTHHQKQYSTMATLFFTNTYEKVSFDDDGAASYKSNSSCESTHSSDTKHDLWTFGDLHFKHPSLFGFPTDHADARIDDLYDDFGRIASTESMYIYGTMAVNMLRQIYAIGSIAHGYKQIRVDSFGNATFSSNHHVIDSSHHCDNNLIISRDSGVDFRDGPKEFYNQFYTTSFHTDVDTGIEQLHANILRYIVIEGQAITDIFIGLIRYTQSLSLESSVYNGCLSAFVSTEISIRTIAIWDLTNCVRSLRP